MRAWAVSALVTAIQVIRVAELALIVSHGSEVPYIYPADHLFGLPWDKSPSQLVLEENMMDYWISFAGTLNPNDNHGNTNRKLK